MISSGTKRGLAVAAVSALALAGIPALASSAQAAVGDSFTVVSTGPALNGGTDGALVVIRAKTGTITGADLAAVGTSSTAAGSANTGDQTIGAITTDAPVADGATGFEFISVHVPVITSTTGDTATFRLFEDDAPNNGDLDAAEARQTVAISTAGDMAQLKVSPASQSTPQGQTSGAYTVTAVDSAGRTTQLESGSTIAVSTTDVTVTPSDASITAAEIADGTYDFTVGTTNATAVDNYTITLNPSQVGPADATANLAVTAAAAVNASNVDIVTGADDWDGFGSGSAGGTTLVRVDQSSIRIDIKGSTPGGTVSLNLGGGDVKFGGKDDATVSTVLDATGAGSLTITPDAGTVQVGDVINVTGSFDQDLEFERSEPTSVVAGTNPYFSALKATTHVTATVVDQFGDPIGSGFVASWVAAGPNVQTPPGQVAAVAADGTVGFDFTDAKAVVGDTDNIAFGWVPDQYETNPVATGGTTIKYTATGQGKDFNTTLEGKNTGSPAYVPSDVVVVPLADTVPNNADEAATIAVAGAENTQAITLSVDNGAQIVKTGQALSTGSASVTDTTDGSGNLTGYEVVGTKSGIVTLTIESANRTETAQLTVAPETDTTTARNVTVSGLATVESGTTQTTYTAVVTDAFGNPVVGLFAQQLNVQVTGPAQFQDGDAATNAAGEINLNLRLDSDAVGDVSIRVQGIGSQFGAAADRLSVGSVSDDAKGLPVSSDVATATTTVEAAPVEVKGINLKLSGKNNGKKADKLTANANKNAAGLKAVLYKGNKKVASHKLNASGNYTFKVKDTNGAKKTKYTVKVKATDTTKAGKASKSVK